MSGVGADVHGRASRRPERETAPGPVQGRAPFVTAGQRHDPLSPNSVERMMKRFPVGDSTLKPLPRPGTTSMVR